MLLTQEKKFFLQKASPSNIENAREVINSMDANSEIEKEFLNDLLVQISGNKECDYQKAVEESGVFYFFNDYSIGRE